LTTHVFGQTTTDSPTLWFHISEPVSGATLEFVLQDDEDRDVYRTTVSLPNEAGLVSVFLPAEQVSFENGELFHWWLKLNPRCSEKDIPPLILIDGWIERVDLPVADQAALEQADLPQQIQIYGSNGIWFDALDQTIEFRQATADSPEAMAIWRDMLQAVDLSDLEEAPIISQP
jgi:hypothetical protein